MRIIGYVRVSTEEQGKTGLSLAVQTERVLAYAKARGWETPLIFPEVASAKDLDRPELASILKNPPNRLIVVKLDRLTRSVQDLGRLLEWASTEGVELASIDESLDASTSAGRLMLNILVSVSQWEREAIGERTKVVLASKKANGMKYSGTPPYGWLDAEGHLRPNEYEQAVLGRIWTLHRAGYGYNGIARELAFEGFYSRGGKRILPTLIKKVLHREEEPGKCESLFEG